MARVPERFELAVHVNDRILQTPPELLRDASPDVLTTDRVGDTPKLGASLPRGRAQLFPDVGHMGPITHAPLVNTAIAEHLRASQV